MVKLEKIILKPKRKFMPNGKKLIGLILEYFSSECQKLLDKSELDLKRGALALIIY